LKYDQHIHPNNHMAEQTIWVEKSSFTGWIWVYLSEPKVRKDANGRTFSITMVDWSGTEEDFKKTFGKNAFEELKDIKANDIPHEMLVENLKIEGYRAGGG